MFISYRIRSYRMPRTNVWCSVLMKTQQIYDAITLSFWSNDPMIKKQTHMWSLWCSWCSVGSDQFQVNKTDTRSIRFLDLSSVDSPTWLDVAAMSSALEQLNINPNLTLGTLLVGTYISTALFGFTSLQTYNYYNTYVVDHVHIKVLVSQIFIT